MLIKLHDHDISTFLGVFSSESKAEEAKLQNIEFYGQKLDEYVYDIDCCWLDQLYLNGFDEFTPVRR